MILLLVAFAQAATPPVPSAETLRRYPPIIVSPPVAPPAPPAPMPSFDRMTAAGRALVQAQDKRIAALDRDEGRLEADLAVAWVDALKALPFDPERLKRAGRALDDARRRPGVFVGWADVMAKLSEDDRNVLRPRLRSARGRVYFNPPSPPTIVVPSASETAKRTALNEGMATLFKEMGERRQTSARLARQVRIEILRSEAAAVIRRKPFDAAAAKAALRRAQALKNEDDSLTTDATIDVVARLPADQRDAIIAVLWSDTRIQPVPPAPRVPVPPVVRALPVPPAPAP